jgi:polysaccharide deacetylase 2 family uncharacterized protein YibQ
MDGERTSFRTVTTLMALPVIGLAVFFGWNWLHGGETPEEAWRDFRHETAGPSNEREAPESETGKSATRPRETRQRETRQRETPAVPPSTTEAAAIAPNDSRKASRAHRGDIVLIIDDLGFDGQPLERLMSLDPNLNAAILPNGTRATDFAERLHARGHEILVHLPMEPVGGESPGRDAILTSMADEEIARLTRENIEAVPHARGVNNHMGSRATADRRVMTTVLSALPDGMYFIDSRTSGKSLAARLAKDLNVRTAARHVFLDDVATEAAVRRQVRELASAAEKRGVAIGIGHPYAVTVKVLTEEMPALRAQGFRFVRASEVVQ